MHHLEILVGGVLTSSNNLLLRGAIIPHHFPAHIGTPAWHLLACSPGEGVMIMIVRQVIFWI